jgi:hypothetical protein
MKKPAWFVNAVRRLDMPVIAAALRTGGALLLVNSLVVPILKDGIVPYVWILPITGIILIIATSIKPKASKE